MDSKVENEITQTLEKYDKESYSAQSRIGQNALIQSKVFEEAIIKMGDTIEDMDREMEQKDNKLEILEIRMGLPGCKVLEEMKRFQLNKISSKQKRDRTMDRINKSLNNHKYFKNKKQKKIKYFTVGTTSKP